MRVFGGAEVWTLDAARGLQERGLEISLVAQPGTELAARARGAGIRVAEIPIRFDGAPWTIARLCRFFRRRRVEAVLCNLTKDLKAAGVAARLAGIETVLALRESDFPLKNRLHYRFYFTRIASGLVANSEATRRTVLHSAPWLDPGKVHRLYKGIDPERFAPPEEPPSRPTVGFVGQLIERKGLGDLMAAWSELEAESWPVPPRLLLAGDGPLAGTLERWRDGLLHPSAVEHRGFVEPIERFLAELSLLVLPSLAEGFGLAAAEAAACELPVVATRTSSLPEVVDHGRTGLLVPPRAPSALAAAIRRLLADPALRSRLGRQGRREVIRRFSRDRMLDALADLVRPRRSR
jgi:glycosyltransferase involved in cell wall biosynthesis